MKPTRIPSLDGLRAISILCVIAGHLGAGPALGTFGVNVFFVISGYLITSLLQNEQDASGRINLLAFYLRRSFRIFPASFAFIGFTALMAPSARPDLLYAVTYTMSYHMDKSSQLLSHLWSLSVEEQFYLLWPLALVLAFRRRSRIAIAVMLLSAAFRLGCSIVSPDQMLRMLHFSFPGVADSIAAGCLLAIYEPAIKERRALVRHMGALALSLPMVALGLAFALWNGTFPPLGEASHPWIAAVWGVIPLVIAFWIFTVVQRRDWILNNPIASAIGALSYSLYLWQQPFTVGHKGPILGSMLLLCGFALLSYGLIEKPMIRLGAELAKRDRASRAQVVDVPFSGPECSHYQAGSHSVIPDKPLAIGAQVAYQKSHVLAEEQGIKNQEWVTAIKDAVEP